MRRTDVSAETSVKADRRRCKEETGEEKERIRKKKKKG